jgi:octaprenyl-diphosphate synthase
LSSPATTTAKEVFELLREDLAAIEREFGRDTVSSVRAITDIGEYLRAGGGKRIRPVLLLLSAKLFPHDENIIDEAKTRRGRPAANTQWGNSKCVLAGDWLYMQAFKIAVQERNFRVLDVLIDLTQQMVEGELLQMEKLGKIISLEEHFDLIFRKTACLFSVSTRLGAIIGDASTEQEGRLGEYGRNLGLAFQIVDDVLDLTASEEVLGKPVASDLREGKVTMAVIHALQNCTPAERALVEAVLEERAFVSVKHEQILEMLNRYESIPYAYDAAAKHAEMARKAICTFPDSEIKRALLSIPDFIVERNS